jgi:hypothetical protein
VNARKSAANDTGQPRSPADPRISIDGLHDHIDAARQALTRLTFYAQATVADELDVSAASWMGALGVLAGAIDNLESDMNQRAYGWEES